MKNPVAAFLSCMLSCCLVAFPVLAQTSSGTAGPRELVLGGPITSAAVDGIARSLEGATAARVLRVNSAGGDADAAMRLGRMIYERDLQVNVERVCATVCALYLLPASPRVTFEKDAVIVFAQMPSPQLHAIELARASQPGTSPEDRDRFGREQATLRRVLVAQDAFYRAIGVDPSRMYRTMDVWMDVNRAAPAAGRPGQMIGLVPDLHFLQRCLGLNNIGWRPLSVEDSVRLAHIGRTPLAVMVDGDAYYEGTKVSSQRIAC
jgi:hypothetical protein